MGHHGTSYHTVIRNSHYRCQPFHESDFRFCLFFLIRFFERIIWPSNLPHSPMQVRKLQARISAENGSTNNLEDRGTVTLVCHVRQIFHSKKHFIFRYQVGRDCLAFFQPSLNLEITFLISPGVNRARSYQRHTIIAILRREIYILRRCIEHQFVQQLNLLGIVHKQLVLSETFC